MKHTYTIILIFVVQMLAAQCYPDRHNTTWYDAWTSCTPSPNPNVIRGESHWILYNLGHLYELKDSKFWNANHPDFLQDGLKDVIIDYSLDGTNWEEWGIFTLPIASGSNTYEGSPGPDFTETTARYVLITAINNYGGNCYSMSELKINVAPAPLAVAWSELKAEGRQTDIQLTWTTYLEKDHTAYEIQRSTNGQHFKKIDWIASTGDSQEQKDYQIFDKKVQTNTLYYYRLKQIDQNGRTASFSNIATASIGDKAFFSVAPNPFNNLSLLKFYLRRDQQVSIALYTPTGQLVQQLMMQQDLEEGAHQIQIQGEQLSAGVYFVMMESLDIRKTETLVLIR